MQSSSLGLVFHWADKAGLPLLDLKDLRAVITYLTSDAGEAELAALGGLSKATAGVILRELIAFADQGGEQFFGEPEFDTAELLRTTADGKGIVSVLELAGVQDKPALFSTFLMWLLADLHHDLPEVGDLDRPKLVFFFDEAHLLFRDASKDFLDQIAQTVRLIRSKGVGVFFVTQVPTDVPPEVLAQLGNRVQHALRVFTPNDAKSLSVDGVDVSAVQGLRPGRTPARSRDRRSGRHRAVGNRCPYSRGVDAAAPTDVAHGPARPGRAEPTGAGVANRHQVRTSAGPRVRLREAACEDRRPFAHAAATASPAPPRAPRRLMPTMRSRHSGRKSARYSGPARSRHSPATSAAHSAVRSPDHYSGPPGIDAEPKPDTEHGLRFVQTTVRPRPAEQVAYG